MPLPGTLVASHWEGVSMDHNAPANLGDFAGLFFDDVTNKNTWEVGGIKTFCNYMIATTIPCSRKHAADGQLGHVFKPHQKPKKSKKTPKRLARTMSSKMGGMTMSGRSLEGHPTIKIPTYVKRGASKDTCGFFVSSCENHHMQENVTVQSRCSSFRIVNDDTMYVVNRNVPSEEYPECPHTPRASDFEQEKLQILATNGDEAFLLRRV